MFIPEGIKFYTRHGARRGVSGATVSSGNGSLPVVSSSSSSSSSSSTSSDSSQSQAGQLPTTSKSLIGVCGVVGALLLAIIIWQIRTIHKRRKARAARTARARFSYMYGINTTEKPAFLSFSESDDSTRRSGLGVPVLNPAPADSSTIWKPQTKSVTLRSGVTIPPLAVTHPERSPKVQQQEDEFPPTPKSGPLVPPFPSPPPAYPGRILSLNTIPLPSSPQESEPADIPPPTPMHKSSRRTASKGSNNTSTSIRQSFDLPPVGPSPSPRSASFQYVMDHTYPVHTGNNKPRASLDTLSTSKSQSAQSLPRLMVVTTSFESTLQDELGLRTGEILRLLREFDDEWCLVQRVGRPTAEKGVVPRFCLSERPLVVKHRMRLSNSIFSNARRV